MQVTKVLGLRSWRNARSRCSDRARQRVVIKQSRRRCVRPEDVKPATTEVRWCGTVTTVGIAGTIAAAGKRSCRREINRLAYRGPVCASCVLSRHWAVMKPARCCALFRD